MYKRQILIGDAVSGIISTLAEGELAVWPTVTDGTLNITGAQAGTAVNVFSVGGSLLLSAKVADDGSALLDLSPIPSGLCVVTVGRHSVKVIKK